MYKYSSSKKVEEILQAPGHNLYFRSRFGMHAAKHCFGVQSTLKDFSSGDSCVLEIAIHCFGGKLCSSDNSGNKILFVFNHDFWEDLQY